jgi:hypothetical protein
MCLTFFFQKVFDLGLRDGKEWKKIFKLISQQKAAPQEKCLRNYNLISLRAQLKVF